MPDQEAAARPDLAVLHGRITRLLQGLADGPEPSARQLADRAAREFETLWDCVQCLLSQHAVIAESIRRISGVVVFSIDEITRAADEITADEPVDIDGILIVEDNEDFALVLRQSLLCQIPGCHIRVAPTAKDAVAVIAEDEHLSCALVDLGLPDVSGMEVIGRLLDADPHLPIVVVTGNELGDEVVGVHSQHRKGEFDLDDLSDWVRAAVAATG